MRLGRSRMLYLPLACIYPRITKLIQNAEPNGFNFRKHGTYTESIKMKRKVLIFPIKAFKK